MIECHFCGQQLPDNAKFCHKCSQQIICKECGERLVKGAQICVVCGETLKHLRNSNAPNHIIFSESTTERKFEASFSDETAGNVVETLSSFLPINHRPKFNSVLDQDPIDISPILSYNPEEKKETNEAVNPHSNNNNVDKSKDIDKVFKEKSDGTLSLHMTDLKAKNKVDFAIRATLLYIYYQNEISNISEVPRSDVKSFLKNLGLEQDGSYRAKMSKMKSLFSSISPAYTLSLAGENEAKTYIEQIMSSDIKGDWTIGNLSKISTRQSTNKKVSGDSYSVIASLDLYPKEQESLVDFMNKRNLKSSMELNTVFVYYLEKVVGCTAITPDHVYTCYTIVKKKFPSKLRQSLVDTKRRKAWIETSNMENIKITPTGENFVIYDSLK